MSAEDVRPDLEARLEKARAEVAELEAGRRQLLCIEHDLAGKIATLLPHETLKLRGELRDVLEATVDATARLEVAQKQVAEAEQNLRQHNGRLERERLTIAYAAVRAELLHQLKDAGPLYAQLDSLANEIAAVVMGLGSRRSLNLSPVGLGVVDGEIKLIEGQPWADG